MSTSAARSWRHRHLPRSEADIQKQMDEIALDPEAIARAMAFAIEQPDDVDVGDIVVRPTVQG